MSDVDVKMHSEMPFSQFIDPYSIKEIVSSRTAFDFDWKEKTRLQDFTNGIDKIVIPVDITKAKIWVLTQVSAGRLIKRHKHEDEPMLRYITRGSFLLNDEKYIEGEWVIVPTGHEYEIYTYTGYTAMMPYGMSCQCSLAGGH